VSGTSSNRIDRKVNGVVVGSPCFDWVDRLVSTAETGLTGAVSYEVSL
jgi:hypothetical protein